MPELPWRSCHFFWNTLYVNRREEVGKDNKWIKLFNQKIQEVPGFHVMGTRSTKKMVDGVQQDLKLTLGISGEQARLWKASFTSLIKWGWRWDGHLCCQVFWGEKEKKRTSCLGCMELQGFIEFYVAEPQHPLFGSYGCYAQPQTNLLHTSTYFCSAWSSLLILYFENYRVFSIGNMSWCQFAVHLSPQWDNEFYLNGFTIGFSWICLKLAYLSQFLS